VGVFLEGGGTWLNFDVKPLAGRSETDFVSADIVLKQSGRIGESLYVADADGRRSPSFTIPNEIRAKVNGE
jgi:hypothetical protein